MIDNTAPQDIVAFVKHRRLAGGDGGLRLDKNNYKSLTRPPATLSHRERGRLVGLPLPVGEGWG